MLHNTRATKPEEGHFLTPRLCAGLVHAWEIPIGGRGLWTETRMPLSFHLDGCRPVTIVMLPLRIFYPVQQFALTQLDVPEPPSYLPVEVFSS